MADSDHVSLTGKYEEKRKTYFKEYQGKNRADFFGSVDKEKCRPSMLHHDRPVLYFGAVFFLLLHNPLLLICGPRIAHRSTTADLCIYELDPCQLIPIDLLK